MSLIGYARVSKRDGSQLLDLQIDALKVNGVKEQNIYTDTASGAKDGRPGEMACLKALREGDVLVIWRLDRLGRNLINLLTIVNDLHKRGVQIRTITGFPVDTTTPSGKLMFQLSAMLAEYERAQMIERTNAGLSSARARGRIGGRKPAMTKAMLLRAQAAMSKRDGNGKLICRVDELIGELGVSRAVLYKYVSPEGDLRDMGKKVMGK